MTETKFSTITLKSLQDRPRSKEEDKDPKPFKYVNSLCRRYNRKNKVITSIKFPAVSNSEGESNEIITFDSPVTEAKAISAAEKYLNDPVTEEYFTSKVYKLPEGMTHRNMYKYRYDMIGGYIFLEALKIEKGQITMQFGS